MKTIPGKMHQFEPTEGWPSVIITTYRLIDDNTVAEDVLSLKTSYPPTIGSRVMDFAGQFHTVVAIDISYQKESTPVMYVYCQKPKNRSLKC